MNSADGAEGLQGEGASGQARVRALEDRIQGLERRLDQSSRLLDVARFMGTEKNLEKLLEYTAGQVTHALKADRCSIFLLDEARGQIWSKLASKQTQEIRFPRGEGLAGHTIDTGEVLLIPDPYADPRFNRSIDEKTGYRTRNLVCVPLKNVEGKSIGCFQVVNKLDGSFDRSDLDFLEAFGSQAAVAIDSAQLHEEKERVITDLVRAETALRQKVRQLEIVFDLEKSVNEIEDFDAFIQYVAKCATESVDGAAGCALLVDPNGGFDLYGYRGEGTGSKVHIEKPPGLLGAVIQSGTPMLENDVRSNPHYSPEVAANFGLSPSRAIVVPLDMTPDAGDADHIGALEIFDNQGGRFEADDLHVLRVISAQITSGILRKRLVHEKERSQRLATIGTLASTIIHDFKNPMSIVRGYAEIIQRMQLAPEKKEHFCKIIVAEVDRCVNMTKELLYFARGEKNYSFGDIPTTQFVDELSLILEDETKRHDILFNRVVEYTGTLRLDLEKMKRVIFNLSNNAIQVLKPGDTFSIECRSAGKMVEIRIRDTGPGIPQAIRATLFTPFVTHGKKDGTGLGLAIAKDIVEHHGGRIYLDESVTPGACFVIELSPAPAPA